MEQGNLQRRPAAVRDVDQPVQLRGMRRTQKDTPLSNGDSVSPYLSGGHFVVGMMRERRVSSAVERAVGRRRAPLCRSSSRPRCTTSLRGG